MLGENRIEHLKKKKMIILDQRDLLGPLSSQTTHPPTILLLCAQLSIVLILQTLCEALVVQSIHIAQSLLIPHICILETSPHNFLIEALYLAIFLRNTCP